jgi:hypothetical protein
VRTAKHRSCQTGQRTYLAYSVGLHALTRMHGALQIVFALVALLLAVGSASAARKLAAPMLPPLPIDPRAEAMAAQVTTADSLAAAVPLFSNAIWVRPRCQRRDNVWLLQSDLLKSAGDNGYLSEDMYNYEALDAGEEDLSTGT